MTNITVTQEYWNDIIKLTSRAHSMSLAVRANAEYLPHYNKNLVLAELDEFQALYDQTFKSLD